MSSGMPADHELLLGAPLDERPGETVPKDAPHWRREHYIPLRKSDLVRLLSDDIVALEGGAPPARLFRELCCLLESVLCDEFHGRLQRIKDLYAPFNPDAVTLDPHSPDEAARRAMAPRLFEDFVALLERANYQRLSRTQIEEVVGAASDWGVRLDVDFSLFDHLDVFVRGDVIGNRELRHWKNWYRTQIVDVPVYQRLVVIFKMRPHKRLDRSIDTDCVYIKLFKNIPKQDVDMLLPGARFKMSWVDHTKILLPSVSGLVLAGVKIVKGALFAMFAGFYGILLFLGFLGGTLGYGVKSILSYLRTKDKYHLTLTRSLYYQNLDNNAGVLFRMLDEAEEQEFREAILGYTLLLQKADPEGWTADQLDRAAEAYLAEKLEFDVDFEVHDALDKLARLGCARETDGRWRALSMEQAVRALATRRAEASVNERWDPSA